MTLSEALIWLNSDKAEWTANHVGGGDVLARPNRHRHHPKRSRERGVAPS